MCIVCSCFRSCRRYYNIERRNNTFFRNSSFSFWLNSGSLSEYAWQWQFLSTVIALTTLIDFTRAHSPSYCNGHFEYLFWYTVWKSNCSMLSCCFKKLLKWLNSILRQSFYFISNNSDRFICLIIFASYPSVCVCACFFFESSDNCVFAWWPFETQYISAHVYRWMRMRFVFLFSSTLLSFTYIQRHVRIMARPVCHYF